MSWRPSLTVPLAGKEAFVTAGGLAHLPPLLDDKEATLCLHTLQVSHAAECDSEINRAPMIGGGP